MKNLCFFFVQGNKITVLPGYLVSAPTEVKMTRWPGDEISFSNWHRKIEVGIGKVTRYVGYEISGYEITG